MKHLIYADNAATTILDQDAFDAMKPYLLENYGNPSQLYGFGKTAKKAIKEARAIIAQCINAEPDEIIFTSGGTESDNWVIKEIALESGKGKNIITSSIEHHAILNSCLVAKKMGCDVTYLPVSREGVIEPNQLLQSITDNTVLVSIMFSNNEIGTVQPISELANIAHRKGILFHTDAVQAVGHTAIDVKKLGVDMLSASAHKFNGPKGIGFLYISNKVKIGAWNSGGSQEFGMRAGTENVAAIVGMAIALKNNCAALTENQDHLIKLEKLFMDKMTGMDFIRNGAEVHMPGCINISFRDMDGEAILRRLDMMGICISTGSACDSVNSQLSHVIKAIAVPEEYAFGTIRLSFGKYNTEDDINDIASAIRKIVLKN